MPDDLQAITFIRYAIAMMKMETLRLPRVGEIDNAGQTAIMVARNNDNRALLAKPLDQLGGLVSGGAIVHEIAQDNQAAWTVIAQ